MDIHREVEGLHLDDDRDEKRTLHLLFELLPIASDCGLDEGRDPLVQKRKRWQLWHEKWSCRGYVHASLDLVVS